MGACNNLVRSGENKKINKRLVISSVCIHNKSVKGWTVSVLY